jgi:hypothetical protein
MHDAHYIHRRAAVLEPRMPTIHTCSQVYITCKYSSVPVITFLEGLSVWVFCCALCFYMHAAFIIRHRRCDRVVVPPKVCQYQWYTVSISWSLQMQHSCMQAPGHSCDLALRSLRRPSSRSRPPCQSRDASSVSREYCAEGGS